VEEVLGSILAPAQRERVLAEALELAGLEAIPETPVSLRVFVEGALFSCLSSCLDDPDALELVAQIRASLALAFRAVEDERPPSHVRQRLGPVVVAPGRVVVLTQASLVVFLLQDVLGDGVDVLPVSSLAELRDRLRRLAGQALLVIVDRKHSCVDHHVAELLASELDASSRVIWWGSSHREQEDVTVRLYGGPSLVPSDFDLSLADLGELCRSLLRDRG
jgi:hypothetical protein